MATPPSFRIMYVEGKVYKLKKALFGLKQSPCAWFERFRSTMLKSKCKQAQADHTLFVRRQGPQVTILIIYIGCIIVTGNYATEVALLKESLVKEFEIKDLRSLQYFLGIEVAKAE